MAGKIHGWERAGWNRGCRSPLPPAPRMSCPPGGVLLRIGGMSRNLFCMFGLWALWPVGRTPAAVYAFTLTPAGSGLNGNIGPTAATAGSLQGDYDAVDNPAGTRTKPGLFGTFGATENVPVPVELAPALSGPLATQASGRFQLEVNEAAGTLLLSGLTVDWLASGPVTVSTGVTLTYGSFRTRSPDSLFIGGFPVTLPLGNGELSSLLGEQTGPAAGTLTALGSGLYDFTVTVVKAAIQQVAGRQRHPWAVHSEQGE